MNEIRECLMIDDDPDDQEFFQMCLYKISPNVRCTTMSNGAEALQMLKSNEEYIPQYIFIDVNMPKMGGIECLKELKKIDRLKQSRIFMYSTTTGYSAIAQAKELGAEDFIIKPAKAAELKEKLGSIFQIVSSINKQ